MILRSASFVTQLAGYAGMAFVQSIDVLPKMRIASVEFITQIAVENLMLAAAMRAEVLERGEIACVAFGARQFCGAFGIRVNIDVVARIEHFRLFFAECKYEIVHNDVIFDCLRVIVAVAANFADVLRQNAVQPPASFEMRV